ncbi:MAG TPA: hypothetical protein PLE85_10985 [Bacteroidales bacterium]|nr:hypothetical protein [Bacteroidales bacterium]
MKTATAKTKQKNQLPETPFVLCNGPITENEKTFWKVAYYPKGSENDPKYYYTVYSQEKSTTLSQKIATDQNCALIIQTPSEN